MASSRNLLITASGLLMLLTSEAEAQIFSSAATTSGLSNTASDVLSGRFLNTLNTTQVALIISIGGLAILAIAGILFLVSFFRPASASASSGSSAYGSDYASSSTQSSSYSYPGYRRLRYSWRGGWGAILLPFFKGTVALDFLPLWQ
jgi:hypothetical protein